MNANAASKLSPRQKQYRNFFRDKMKKHGINKLGDERNKDKLPLLFKEVKRGWKNQSSNEVIWQERSDSLNSLLHQEFANTRFVTTSTGACGTIRKILNAASVKKLVHAFVDKVKDYNKNRIQCSPKKWNEAVARVHRQYRGSGQPEINNAAIVLMYERNGGTWRDA